MKEKATGKGKRKLNFRVQCLFPNYIKRMKINSCKTDA